MPSSLDERTFGARLFDGVPWAPDDIRRRRVKEHEIEPMRRSLSMSASLPRDQTERLVSTCQELLAERRHIERILADLQPVWRDARRALNELHSHPEN